MESFKLNRNKFILLLITLVSFSVFSQENDTSIKKQLHGLSKKQISYLCNGEITNYLQTYSKEYTDLGGGSNGDGTIDFSLWYKKLIQFTASEDFQKIKGKSISQVLDTEKQKILNFSEIVKEKGEIDRFNFILQKGDYYVSFPPKKGAFLSDGWFAFFRLENNEWKIIAGD